MVYVAPSKPENRNWPIQVNADQQLTKADELRRLAKEFRFQLMYLMLRFCTEIGGLQYGVCWRTS
jgi:hypothetical protein